MIGFNSQQYNTIPQIKPRKLLENEQKEAVSFGVRKSDVYISLPKGEKSPELPETHQEKPVTVVEDTTAKEKTAKKQASKDFMPGIIKVSKIALPLMAVLALITASVGELEKLGKPEGPGNTPPPPTPVPEVVETPASSEIFQGVQTPAAYNTAFGFEEMSLEDYRTERMGELKLYENAFLASGSDTSTLKPYSDTSIAIGYGIDLLENDNERLNTYLAQVGMELSEHDATMLRESREIARDKTGITYRQEIIDHLVPGFESEQKTQAHIKNILANLQMGKPEVAKEIVLGQLHDSDREEAALNLLDQLAQNVDNPEKKAVLSESLRVYMETEHDTAETVRNIRSMIEENDFEGVKESLNSHITSPEYKEQVDQAVTYLQQSYLTDTAQHVRKELADYLELDLETEANAAKISEFALDTVYEPLLTETIGFEMAPSRVKVSMVSLVYNKGDKIIHPELKDALTQGDQIKTWYEFRYFCNDLERPPRILDVLAKRRYSESDYFSPYKDIEKPTPQEARAFLEFLNSPEPRNPGRTRLETIKEYEARYDPTRNSEAIEAFVEQAEELAAL